MATLTNSLDTRLGYQLRRASALMMADLARELAALDLRPAEVTALLMVEENPGCSQSEVGQALGIKRANMVPIISRLMDRDLLARDRVDGRSHALRLTPTGADAARDARARIDGHEARFLALLEKGDLAALFRSLAAIRSAHEDEYTG